MRVLLPSLSKLSSISLSLSKYTKISTYSSTSSSASSLFLESILRSRYSENNFDNTKQIDNAIVKKLIEMAQLAPSSFNIQPYKLILIKSNEMREVIAEQAMLEGNKKKVRDAPLTVVFLSHKKPTELIQKLMKLELSNGKTIGYVNSLPSAIGILQSKGWLSTKLRQTATTLLSPIKAMPVIPNSNSDSWSIKNTTFAAQNFMLAATAYGLSTCAMEGFDERRLCNLLEIPSETFTVPFVISTGYPQKPQDNGIKQKVRFSPEETCYSERFGHDVVF